MKQPIPAAVLVTALTFALTLGLAAPAAGQLASELVVSGLDRPLFLTAPRGDARLFVVERDGRVQVIEGGSVRATPFLDITTRIDPGGEGGLLGLAFDPRYAETGLFYVYYTDLGGDSVVSRFAVSADPNRADPTETVILRVGQPFGNHNGGTLAFGPDGFLYLGLGDGGSSYDPGERAQDPGDLLGKMLRLDVGTPPRPDSIPVTGAAYAIPADNPFVGVAGYRPEIWALGLRNPYRWSFNPLTRNLWIADVGQGAREEIHLEPWRDRGGRNFGWDVMEGSLCVGTDPASSPPCNDPSLSLPVYEYDHSGGNCSITGGYAYRGHRIPHAWGLYFYGDFCSGRVWSYDLRSDTAWERTAELAAPGAWQYQLVGFGEDGAGELYVVLQSGSVHRIVSDGSVVMTRCGAEGGTMGALVAPVVLWARRRVRRGQPGRVDG